ncbi:MAG: DUF262 domain-containing protein [bacterium]|nr:DUF262 domain-containing protein [bacterium]
MFKPVPWTVQNLVAAVQSGALRLPDIQRPFVWGKVKVRDLVDSIYRGYPVGELMFWNSAGDDDAVGIGEGVKTKTAAAKIVDGQQRLTSLYAVMTGEPVVDDEYRRGSIKIAFNPLTERFEVQSAALVKSREWVPDISDVFKSPYQARKAFLGRYKEGHDLSEADEEEFEAVFTRLHGIRDYSFTVVELQAETDREKVADVFVRINSEGVNLTQADFILTWLSVFWDEGREQLERFSRHSRLTPDAASVHDGEHVSWTPKNHYIAPEPGRMLRAVVAVGQGRARLRNAYHALRGRDPQTREFDERLRDRELELLKAAQREVLRPVNWGGFLRVLAKAGFRSKRMITSDNTVIYTYALWLIGSTRFNLDKATLSSLMARWFFMAQTTGRYTNSPESSMEEDLARFRDLDSHNPEDFIASVRSVIATVLTPDFWAIQLPDEFITSSTAVAPAYKAYLAALNILDADLFAINEKAWVWMDPSAGAAAGVESHHLFPRAHLKSQGITATKRINQVANFAPTDSATNKVISSRSPKEYWPALVAERNITGEVLENQRFWHALPDGWESMEYDEFLDKRRREMARVTEAGFRRLSDPHYKPNPALAGPVSPEEDTTEAATLSELVAASLLKPGDLLIPVDPERDDTIAEITDDSLIALDGHVFDSPLRAARADGDERSDGWDYWVLFDDAEPPRTLRELSKDHRLEHTD